MAAGFATGGGGGDGVALPSPAIVRAMRSPSPVLEEVSADASPPADAPPPPPPLTADGGADDAGGGGRRARGGGGGGGGGPPGGVDRAGGRRSRGGGAVALSFVSSRRASLRLEQPAAPAPQDERMLNERAVSVIRRIKSKLAGNDFKEEEAGGPLDVPTQVNRLISEAQANYNLCQLYIGCARWPRACRPPCDAALSMRTAQFW